MLGITGIDLHTSRSGCTKSDAGKLQAGRSIARARFDKRHRVFVCTAFFQQLETVVDRADRRDDVMTDPAAQKRTEVECGKGNGQWHGDFSRHEPTLKIDIQVE
ncbi:hypothetical protein D9M69_670780 [compost metagenome]